MAVYDATTLQRLDFRPAPNSGVWPQYGFAVASDRRFTYLFGNSNMLNWGREGGFFSTPHSATRMYLARVRRGRLTPEPVYRTARGWSRDPDDAVPISDRFVAANTMQPRFIDGRWIAVTKVDEFVGEDVVSTSPTNRGDRGDGASLPDAPTRYPNEAMTTYQPILLPWPDPSGRLILVLSQNNQGWMHAVVNPQIYRPAFYTLRRPR